MRAASERPLIIPVQWLHQQKRTQDGEKAVDPSGYHWNDMTEGNRWEDIDNELIAEIDGWLQTAPLRRYCTSYIYVRNDLLLFIIKVNLVLYGLLGGEMGSHLSTDTTRLMTCLINVCLLVLSLRYAVAGI